jgi:hypothetical protein
MAEASTGGHVGAAIGSHGLRKALSWKDGLAVAMVMPAGAIASYGYWQNSLGTWAVMLLLGLSALMAVLRAFVFPTREHVPPEARRVALFAHEGWKRYECRWRCRRSAPGSAVGRLAINGVVIGSLMQAQFFPSQHGAALTSARSSSRGVSAGGRHSPHAAVWLLNVPASASWRSRRFARRPAGDPLAFFIFGPFITGTGQV